MNYSVGDEVEIDQGTRRMKHKQSAALANIQPVASFKDTIFDDAFEGMLVLDETGIILRANPSLLRMFGYSHRELAGRHVTILTRGSFGPIVSRRWIEATGEDRAPGAEWREELIVLRKGGSVFQSEIAISPFLDHGERQYVAMVRDISELKQAEAMKNEFLSTVSHELRTPLTSIGGSLGLLAGSAVGKLNVNAARLVDIAHKNCMRLARLIDDILDFEKISSGTMHFAQDKVDLEALAKRTVGENHAFAAAQGVTLVTRDAGCRIEVLGDADRLEQALTNLVSNAIKHSPDGEAIEICLQQFGSMGRIEVRDRGGGVPPEFSSQIFDKFSIVDGSDKRVRSGMGLGLSIASEIAQHHGGKVSYEERKGGGSVFWIELPTISTMAPGSSASSGLTKS